MAMDKELEKAVKNYVLRADVLSEQNMFDQIAKAFIAGSEWALEVPIIRHDTELEGDANHIPQYERL